MQRGVLLATALQAAWCWAAGPDDFAFKVLPAETVFEGFMGETVSGAMTLTVTLDAKNGGTQGAAFGVRLLPADDAAMHITSIKYCDEVLTFQGGHKPDSLWAAYYASSDLRTPAGSPWHDGRVTEIAIPDCTAVTFGVLFDSMVYWPSFLDVELISMTLEASGPVEAAERQLGQVVFTNEVGNPPTPTSVVHGGATIFPSIQAPAIIMSAPKTCVPPADFTIAVQDAAVEPEEEGDCARTSMDVVLNFQAKGPPITDLVQGWSYSVCADDVATAKIVAATIDGTDAGALPRADLWFCSIRVEAGGCGVTQGVILDDIGGFMPVTDHFSALAMTVEACLPAPSAQNDSPEAFFYPCSSVFGNPPTVAAMITAGGESVMSSQYFGTDPDDPEHGCCDPAICNRPGRVYSAFRRAAFVPGDANGDALIDVADGILLLGYLFRRGRAPTCLAAADFNGDGALDVSDVVAVIGWQFQSGAPPALGLRCGTFRTKLACDAQAACGR